MRRGNSLGVSITVVGLGLIGGSIAKALKTSTSHHIIGYDVNKEIMKEAINQNVIDEMPENIEKALAKSDLVFLCLYPFETVSFVKANYNHFKEGALVTDTAGLKSDIVKYFAKLTHNGKHIDFIGGHPIAGSEKSGFSNSSEHLFRNASYVLTPHRGNRIENIDKLKELILEIGFGNVSCMDADEHDEKIAYTSHLPHIIASLLLKNKPDGSDSSLVGGSFRDATRVGVMNKSLWTELLMCNQSNVLKTLEIFENDLQAVRSALTNQNEEALNGLITFDIMG